MRVLGVDGCKGGWVGVALDNGALADVRYVPSIADLVGDAATVIAIDTPLGETVPGDRGADREARRFLTPHGNRVFSAPLIAALETESREEGSTLQRQICGKGLSAQAWGLRDYMLDARRFWCDDSERIREVHPEGSFRAIAQVPIPSKKRWIGLTTRLRLLAREGLDALALPGVPDEAGIDDLLDAVVAAWSAHRIASGQARCLPDPPERDADGRAVAIWY